MEVEREGVGGFVKEKENEIGEEMEDAVAKDANQSAGNDEKNEDENNEDEDDIGSIEGEFIPTEILHEKTESGQRKYLVMWEDWPLGAATWEPEEHLEGHDSILDRWERDKRRIRLKKMPAFRTKTYRKAFAEWYAKSEEERAVVVEKMKQERVAKEKKGLLEASEVSSDDEEAVEYAEDEEAGISATSKRGVAAKIRRPRSTSDDEEDSRYSKRMRFSSSEESSERSSVEPGVGQLGYRGTANLYQTKKASDKEKNKDVPKKHKNPVKSTKPVKKAAKKGSKTLTEKLLTKPAENAAGGTAKPSFAPTKQAEWKMQRAVRNLADRAPAQMPMLRKPGDVGRNMRTTLPAFQSTAPRPAAAAASSPIELPKTEAPMFDDDDAMWLDSTSPPASATQAALLPLPANELRQAGEVNSRTKGSAQHIDLTQSNETFTASALHLGNAASQLSSAGSSEHQVSFQSTTNVATVSQASAGAGTGQGDVVSTSATVQFRIPARVQQPASVMASRATDPQPHNPAVSARPARSVRFASPPPEVRSTQQETSRGQDSWGLSSSTMDFNPFANITVSDPWGTANQQGNSESGSLQAQRQNTAIDPWGTVNQQGNSGSGDSQAQRRNTGTPAAPSSFRAPGPAPSLQRRPSELWSPRPNQANRPGELMGRPTPPAVDLPQEPRLKLTETMLGIKFCDLLPHVKSTINDPHLFYVDFATEGQDRVFCDAVLAFLRSNARKVYIYKQKDWSKFVEYTADNKKNAASGGAFLIHSSRINNLPSLENFHTYLYNARNTVWVVDSSKCRLKMLFPVYGALCILPSMFEQDPYSCYKLLKNYKQLLLMRSRRRWKLWMFQNYREWFEALHVRALYLQADLKAKYAQANLTSEDVEALLEKKLLSNKHVNSYASCATIIKEIRDYTPPDQTKPGLTLYWISENVNVMDDNELIDRFALEALRGMNLRKYLILAPIQGQKGPLYGQATPERAASLEAKEAATRSAQASLSDAPPPSVPTGTQQVPPPPPLAQLPPPPGPSESLPDDVTSFLRGLDGSATPQIAREYLDQASGDIKLALRFYRMAQQEGKASPSGGTHITSTHSSTTATPQFSPLESPAGFGNITTAPQGQSSAWNIPAAFGNIPAIAHVQPSFEVSEGPLTSTAPETTSGTATNVASTREAGARSPRTLKFNDFKPAPVWDPKNAVFKVKDKAWNHIIVTDWAKANYYLGFDNTKPRPTAPLAPPPPPATR